MKFPKLIVYTIQPFIFGFLLAFIFFNLTNCPDKVTGPGDDNSIGMETPELKSFAKRAENAFQSGSRDSVLAVTYEEFANVTKEYLPNDPDLLKKFGEALTKKKLLFANNFYAEYEIQIDGKTYTIAFAQSGDGVWKLVRF
ncbi:MAG: hypothetical protein N2560_05120 [Ignavibacteria bacterium]|nr:hypothetical protein [Ignavibacteria bacterium]